MADLSRGIQGAASGAAIGSLFPGPGTVIGGALGALAGLFGGGGGPSIEELLERSRRNIIKTGGAAGKLQEHILGQSLAGASSLQKQAVLGRQQNAQLEALFNALTDVERQALQLMVQEQSRKNAAQQQSLFGIGGGLGQLLTGGVPQQQTGGGGVDLNALVKLLQAGPVQQLPARLPALTPPTPGVRG
jgi:hypothetical protein